MKKTTKLFARTIKKLAVGIAIVMLGGCSERNSEILCEKPFIHPIFDLTGTKWTLVGFFDAPKNKLRKPARQQIDGEYCFCLHFITYNSLWVTSWSNRIRHQYLVDFPYSKIMLVSYPFATEFEESDDGRSFRTSILKAHSISANEEELKLFYDKCNYLLFEKTDLTFSWEN